MKRIFIGIDGTSQAAFYGCFQSNVFRLNLALAAKDGEGNQQMFIYLNGVGSSSFRYFGLAGKLFGQGLDEIILQAYVNIISNYEPGDKIYIFGFSRGAVAARALSGLISYSGLLTSSSTSMVEQAWRYFVGDRIDFNWKEVRKKLTEPDANIEFLGVWDTVYGFGTELALRKSHFNRLRFRNFLLDRRVKVGIHVISIDDTRNLFQPMLWTGPSLEHKNQIMEQIWLPGVHGDIGGGYSQNVISTISLFCMLDKLSQYCVGIGYDKEYIDEGMGTIASGRDLVINSEWKKYLGLLDRKTRRCCENNVMDLRQSAHPLVKTMMGKTIDFKGERTSYTPSFKLSDKSRALPDAEFSRGSLTDRIMPRF
jgi:uncharacterized protein (DUF2235 family)